MSRKVLLVAGEASGDVHGAELVTALRHLDPTIEVSGVGGARLRAAGMHVLVDTAEIATMGLTEVVGTLGKLWRTYRQLVRFLRDERPALLVLIDYPEFNMLLAKRAKALGIRVFYYIAPQVWAWRRGRVRKIAARVDRVGVVFPFEAELYNTERQLAEFVGHPMLDMVEATSDRQTTRQTHGLDQTKPLLAILPGSRKKEVHLLLGPALEAARGLRAEGWQAAIALAHTLSPADLREALDGKDPDVPIIANDTYNLVHAADAALVASGTATVETALLGTPMVIMYRVSRFTFALARLLVRVDFIGMPNLILGRSVFPELIQDDANPEKMAAAIRSVAGRREELRAALQELRGKLGEPGAAERAARLALEVMA